MVIHSPSYWNDCSSLAGSWVRRGSLFYLFIFGGFLFCFFRDRGEAVLYLMLEPLLVRVALPSLRRMGAASLLPGLGHWEGVGLG